MERKNLAEEIAHQIRSEILAGRIRAGDRLKESRLASELGTSRGPVREALRLLLAEGVVLSYARKGTFVRDITVRDIDEIFALRRILEIFAVREVVRHASDSDLADLDRYIAMMHEASERGDSAALVDADLQMHQRIIELAGNGRLLRLFASLTSGVRIVITLIGGLYKDGRLIAEDHRRITEAMRRRKVSPASEAMDAHLSEAWRELRQLFRKDSRRRGADDRREKTRG